MLETAKSGRNSLEWAIRDEIVSVARETTRAGLNQGTSGNISARLDENVLITPSSLSYDKMLAQDIVVIDGEGVAAGRLAPSSEWRMHHDILASRPEFGAVIHAHAPYCTALSIARRGIPPCHYMVTIFGGNDVRCATYETFGTAELSTAALVALEQRSACLLANHGLVACGHDLAEALWRAIELETLARQLALSRTFGTKVLGRTAIEDAARQFAVVKVPAGRSNREEGLQKA